MRGPSVRPDDREWLRPLIAEAIAEADQRHDSESYKAAQIAAALIEEHAGRGVRAAQRVLAVCALEGLRQLVVAQMNEDRGTVSVASTGQIVALPARAGVRRKRKGGQRARHFQRPLWADLDWDEYLAYLAEQERNADAVQQRLDALREIARLRALYPNTRTVREACELHGIDPRDVQAI